MVKKYIPNTKEKYMCAKHKTYFKARLMEWRNEILESCSESQLNSEHLNLFVEAIAEEDRFNPGYLKSNSYFIFNASARPLTWLFIPADPSVIHQALICLLILFI